MNTTVPLPGPDWKSLRAGNSFVTIEPPAFEAPQPRWRLRRGPGLALVALGLAAFAFGAASLAHSSSEPGDAPSHPPAAPFRPATPDWANVLHPFAAYDLAGGPFAKLPLRYAARRDHALGAREDLLTYGAPQPGEPFLRLAFLRRGSEAAETTSVFLDAARLAAGVSLAVTRSGLGTKLETRFGPFEVAGVSIEARDRSADCLAFRLADASALPVLGLTGLACGTIEHPIDAATLACTIDRLDLVSAGDDEALRAVFVAAERRRRNGQCSAHAAVELRFGMAAEHPGTRPLREPL